MKVPSHCKICRKKLRKVYMSRFGSMVPLGLYCPKCERLILFQKEKKKIFLKHAKTEGGDLS